MISARLASEAVIVALVDPAIRIDVDNFIFLFLLLSRNFCDEDSDRLDFILSEHRKNAEITI